MAPPTITPCSAGMAEVVSAGVVPAELFIVEDVSVVEASELPDPEQEMTATEKAIAVATGKIRLRINYQVLQPNSESFKRLPTRQNFSFDRFSTVLQIVFYPAGNLM